MASSIIDALLPSPPRPSAGDSPGHGSDGAPFGPVLSEALRADDAPAATPPRVSDDLADAATSDDFRLGDSHDDDHAELEAGDEAVQGEQATEEAVHDDRDDDEVDISEEAAAAEAAAAVAAQNQHSASDEAATADADAAQEAAAIQDAATAAEAESGNASSAANAPTDTKEFGDLIGTARRDASGKSKQAGESDAKGAKVDKSTAAQGKSAKAETRDATVKDGVTEANEEAVDGDDATDGSLVGKSKVAGANSSADAGDEGRDPSASAGRDEKRPTTTASSATAPAIAEPEVAPVAPNAAGGATPTPTPTSADLAAVAPVAAGVTAPTTASRGAAPLARLAAERSIHATAAANGDDGSGGVDRARFVSRVEGAIRSAHQRDGRVQVRLSPPELGSLRIELTMHEGSLSARVEAETTSARKVLLDNLPALRDRLEQQGVRVERFDVDVRQEGGNGGSAQERSDERTAREADRQRPTGRRENSTPTTARVPQGARPGRATADAGLDVTV